MTATAMVVGISVAVCAQALAQDKGAPEFSAEIADQLLHRISSGLEGHDARRLLSAFAPESMMGYLSFEDQVQAMFARYASFRVHFRIVQSSAQPSGGIVVAEMQLEGTPLDTALPPQRKAAELRLKIQHGPAGWKISEITPRSFFS